jgi:hypothetical protein
MIKLLELHRYCSTKLKLKKTEKHRHTNYEIRPNNKMVLPTLIRISRGSGDAARNNISGIANALGLTYVELQNSVACNIRMECVYLCMCLFLLKYINNSLLIDPLVNMDGAKAMIKSIEFILNEISNVNNKKITENEKKTFERIKKELKSLKLANELVNILNKIFSKLEKYF